MTAQRLPQSTPQIDLLRFKAKPLKKELFNNFLPILAQYLQSFNHSNSIRTLKESNTLLRDDLQWSIESFTKDYQDLDKLQDHLEFLNAEETLVTEDELIQEFNEFISFIQGQLLDNILLVFAGIQTEIEDESVKGFIEQSILALKKIDVTLKLLSSCFVKFDTSFEAFQRSLDLFKANYDTLIQLRLQ